MRVTPLMVAATEQYFSSESEMARHLAGVEIAAGDAAVEMDVGVVFPFLRLLRKNK